MHIDEDEEGRCVDKDVFEFVIYMIHACSQKWGQSPSTVYKRLKSADCIDNYLVPYYDVLHTQGTAFVVEDIEKYLSLRGGAA